MKIAIDKLYAIDPYNEQVALMMIDYLGKIGNRSGLKEFYNTYTENLWNEMKLKPKAITKKLYNSYLESQEFKNYNLTRQK